MEWKTKDGSYENTRFAQFDTFFEGIFEKERFLAYARVRKIAFHDLLCQFASAGIGQPNHSCNN